MGQQVEAESIGWLELAASCSFALKGFVAAFGFAKAARLTKFFKIFDCGRFDNDNIRQMG